MIKDFTTQYNKLVALVFGNLWMFLLKRHDIRVVLSKTALSYYQRWFKKKQLSYVYNTRCVDISKTLSDEEKRELQQFKGKAFYWGLMPC